MSASKESFTKQMKRAVRDVHALSDALVNAKLGIALSDSTVWADGLLVFYEIFRYLEEAMDRLGHTHVGDLDIEGMRRTAAFEKDIEFYLGRDWKKDYVVRPSVAEYIHHLQEIEKSDPYLLMAYIYHMYMGLLSGGQILRKKKSFLSMLPFSSKTKQLNGEAVTNFSPKSIYVLKKRLVEVMNSIADQLDDTTKEKLIDESRTVFALNNEVIRSVRNANMVLLKKVAKLLIIVILFVCLYYFYRRLTAEHVYDRAL